MSALCDRTAPLGRDSVPDVYITWAGASAATGTAGSVASGWASSASSGSHPTCARSPTTTRTGITVPVASIPASAAAISSSCTISAVLPECCSR